MRTAPFRQITRPSLETLSLFSSALNTGHAVLHAQQSGSQHTAPPPSAVHRVDSAATQRQTPPLHAQQSARHTASACCSAVGRPVSLATASGVTCSGASSSEKWPWRDWTAEVEAEAEAALAVDRAKFKYYEPVAVALVWVDEPHLADRYGRGAHPTIISHSLTPSERVAVAAALHRYLDYPWPEEDEDDIGWDDWAWFQHLRRMIGADEARTQKIGPGSMQEAESAGRDEKRKE